MPWKEEMRQIDDPVRLRRRPDYADDLMEALWQLWHAQGWDDAVELLALKDGDTCTRGWNSATSWSTSRVAPANN